MGANACPHATEVTDFGMCPPYPLGLGNGGGHAGGIAGSFPPEADAVALKLGQLEHSPLRIEGGYKWNVIQAWVI